ncbi:MAG: AtpZ/AtpI family protein [Sphingomicrobium sp.]
MAEDETDEVPKLPPDARLGSLDERLDQLQRAEAARAASAGEDANSRAGRMVVSQLVGGPLGGAIVGWVLDRWLGTAPWVMLGLMFIGFAGGLISVIRFSSTGQRDAANGTEG